MLDIIWLKLIRDNFTAVYLVVIPLQFLFKKQKDYNKMQKGPLRPIQS